jgi:hypothetical protein
MVDYGVILLLFIGYIYCSIHVWNTSNGQIMVKVEQKNALTPLNLVYGNNHFEHVEIYSKFTNVPIVIHNDEKNRKIINNKNMNN